MSEKVIRIILLFMEIKTYNTCSAVYKYIYILYMNL